MTIDVKHYWKSDSPSSPIVGDSLEIHISVMLDTLIGRVVKPSPRFTYEQPQSFFQGCEDYVRKFLSYHLYTPSDLNQVTYEINCFIREKFSSEEDNDVVNTVAAESEPPREFCLFICIGSEDELREKIKEKGCGVCMKEFYGDGCYDVAWMPCVHAFHRICIATWLRADGFCPVCRLSLQVKKAGNFPCSTN